MEAPTLATSDPTTRGMGRFTEATSLSEGLVTQTITEGITFTAGALAPGIFLWHVGRYGDPQVVSVVAVATAVDVAINQLLRRHSVTPIRFFPRLTPNSA